MLIQKDFDLLPVIRAEPHFQQEFSVGAFFKGIHVEKHVRLPPARPSELPVFARFKPIPSGENRVAAIRLNLFAQPIRLDGMLLLPNVTGGQAFRACQKLRAAPIEQMRVAPIKRGGIIQPLRGVDVHADARQNDERGGGDAAAKRRGRAALLPCQERQQQTRRKRFREQPTAETSAAPPHRIFRNQRKMPRNPRRREPKERLAP